MAAAVGFAWSEVDERIRSAKVSLQAPQQSASASLKVVPAASEERQEAAGAAKAELADWEQVLDSINEAGALAQEQERRLAEQAAAYDQAVAEMSAQVQRLRAEMQAEHARTQTLLAEAEKRARAAEERALIAEARAEHAEIWLNRIGSAVSSLIPDRSIA